MVEGAGGGPTGRRVIREDAAMAMFTRGDPVWVEEEGGERRAGVFVGEAEQATWFGGPPVVYVVFADRHEAVSVPLARVVPREPDAGDESP